MDYMTMVTLLSGTVCHPKANNWYSLRSHKIWRH